MLTYLKRKSRLKIKIILKSYNFYLYFVYRVFFKLKSKKFLNGIYALYFTRLRKKNTHNEKDTLNTLNTMFYIAISGKCFHLLCHEQNYLFYLTFH